MRHPKLFTCGYTSPAGLTEQFVRVKNAADKPKVVQKLLSETENALIFTNSVSYATNLNKLLNEMGVACEELSSHLEDWKRKNAIKKFAKGTIKGG